VVYIGRIKNETLTVPCSNFEVSFVAHNCTFVEVEKRDKTMIFDIVPNLFNVKKLKDSRWSLCVWGEWSGLDEAGNRQKVERLKEEVGELEKEKKEVERKREEVEKAVGGSRIEEWKERVGQLSELMMFLNRKFFKLEETERLFKELTTTDKMT